MRLALLVLAGLAWPQAPTTPPHPESSPGPRKPIAGIAGFQSISRLDVGGSQRRLTAVYLFPDRVRWILESVGEQRPDSLYLYRQGALVHTVAPRTGSKLVSGAERESVVMQMELRRAAMLWPDGFSWSDGEPGTRTARVYLDSCCQRGEIGTLVASDLSGGRPAKIEARFSDGERAESMEIRAWQELQGRSWPLTLAVQSKGGDFVESVESLDTRVHFLDVSFLPPDKRPLPSSEDAGPPLTSRDVVPMTYAVHALPAGLGWDAALEKARAWIAEADAALKTRGIAVDPVATFELDPEGHPARCLVRLRIPCTPPPDAYQTLPERAGVFTVLPELKALDRAVLERLNRAVPEGARRGCPYLRMHTDPKPQVELVLPFEAPD